ncbi:hypothetical protein L5515_011051 [Caenorhabditis briggsae]|uniref:Uncharacterized protein n=1 Tax=Caenorhabditis briggsae TaxID=6238 RepID=A0AAE9JDY2_CAEBR|nr:hypothetical protein L5515_011051 [Caenorhabditis briggsae]
MRKLEYDKSMEDLKSKALENDCPGDMHIIKYSDGVWATNRKSPSGTTDAILASKYACINHGKCGLVGLINKEPNWNDAKKGKPGSGCSGEVDDGLCVGSSAAFSLFIVFSFVSILCEK